MEAAKLFAMLEAEGYTDLKYIDGQGLCGLNNLALTVGLFCGLNENFYKYRYCYPNLLEAMCGLEGWDGTGHPDGDWIVLKGKGDDLQNPALENEHAEKIGV